MMTRLDRLAYLRRDLSGIRHDWARIQGRDTVVQMLDRVMVQMDQEIELEDYEKTVRARA